MKKELLPSMLAMRYLWLGHTSCAAVQSESPGGLPPGLDRLYFALVSAWIRLDTDSRADTFVVLCKSLRMLEAGLVAFWGKPFLAALRAVEATSD